MTDVFVTNIIFSPILQYFLPYQYYLNLPTNFNYLLGPWFDPHVFNPEIVFRKIGPGNLKIGPEWHEW